MRSDGGSVDVCARRGCGGVSCGDAAGAEGDDDAGGCLGRSSGWSQRRGRPRRGGARRRCSTTPPFGRRGRCLAGRPAATTGNGRRQLQGVAVPGEGRHARLRARARRHRRRAARERGLAGPLGRPAACCPKSAASSSSAGVRANRWDGAGRAYRTGSGLSMAPMMILRRVSRLTSIRRWKWQLKKGPLWPREKGPPVVELWWSSRRGRTERSDGRPRRDERYCPGTSLSRAGRLIALPRANQSRSSAPTPRTVSPREIAAVA